MAQVENKPQNNPIGDAWTDEDEAILKEWADKAQCYEWMHTISHKEYSKRYLYLTIPVIIISTITGTANFAQDRVPSDYQSAYTMIVGAFNILAGIVSTIAQFMQVAELRESHAHTGRDWNKFARNIKLELIKARHERGPRRSMIELSKREYDRILENAPTISRKVITMFNEKFANVADLVRPEICDTINPILVYREKVLQRVTSAENNSFNAKRKFYELNGRYPTDVELEDILVDF